MNELIKQAANVIDVVDMSCDMMQRARVSFANGFSLSIIHGEYCYGGSQGLYEIAPFNKDRKMDGSLLDEVDQGDDVLGWCSEEKVKHYIEKIGNLK